MNSLATQIDQLNHELFSQLPQEVFEVFGQSIKDIRTKNIEENSIQVGDLMPGFALPNALGKTILSEDILKNKKMVMAFYRGSWCPYCNLELKFLQDHLSEIRNKDAVLVAISPQRPDHSLSMIEKNNLEFEIITDKNNEYAKKLGIVFQLQNFVLPHYQNLGINLSDCNQNEENTLPVPAVFVVDKNNAITYKFLDVNYMNRVNVEELIQAL